MFCMECVHLVLVKILLYSIWRDGKIAPIESIEVILQDLLSFGSLQGEFSGCHDDFFGYSCSRLGVEDAVVDIPCKELVLVANKHTKIAER